jgi:hypothetical protein
MTKKRRAKAGETRCWNYDVIAYEPEMGWSVRVTVRDRDTGRVVEESSVMPSWALFRAVRKLAALNRSTEALIARLETAARAAESLRIETV